MVKTLSHWQKHRSGSQQLRWGAFSHHWHHLRVPKMEGRHQNETVRRLTLQAYIQPIFCCGVSKSVLQSNDIILNPWSSKNQAPWRWPPRTGGTCGVYDRFQVNFRRVRSVVFRNSWSKTKTACVCVCLGWRMVDDISSYTFHTACTVGFGWMLMDFAFFAGVPEKPSQCFLKLLPFELSRLAKKFGALEVPFVGKQWLHFTSCHGVGKHNKSLVQNFPDRTCKHPRVFP